MSHRLFQKHPKISRIVGSKYPYIFVDEYQDTSSKTISLLTDSLLQANKGKMVVGLFGDEMQKIYNTGVGRVEHRDLFRITKSENYRCSRAVIDVLNRLRPTLQQTAAGDNPAGSVRFYDTNGDSANENVVDRVLKHLDWADQDNKVLMLTHRGLGDRLNYANLLDAYAEKSSFGIEELTSRTDEYAKLFSDIEQLVDDYDAKRYGFVLSLLSRSGQVVQRHGDKEGLADRIRTLRELREHHQVGDVLEYVYSQKLLPKTRRISRLEDEVAAVGDDSRTVRRRNFYQALMAVPYVEVIRMQRYLDSRTPFSTKHGVKGAEFENVLVVIDDRLWNMYNFECVLARDSSRSQYDRSLNLMYVTCSRAKSNLAVLCLSNLGVAALQGATDLFGVTNIMSTKDIS